MPKERKLNIDATKIIATFFDDSSIPRKGKPKLVLILGGVGAGKSTLLRSKFSTGYVVLDAGVIYSIYHNKEYDDLEGLGENVELIGASIAMKAIREKRNIVVEMIGDSKDDLDAVGTAMLSAGYKIDLQFVSCDDISEAYKRHLKAVEEDKSYISSYFTQKSHQNWMLEAVKKLTSEGKFT